MSPTLKVPLSLISQAKELAAIAEATGGSEASGGTVSFLKERASKLHRAICDERRSNKANAEDTSTSQNPTPSHLSQSGTLLSTESIMREILQEQRAIRECLSVISVSPSTHLYDTVRAKTDAGSFDTDVAS